MSAEGPTGDWQPVPARNETPLRRRGSLRVMAATGLAMMFHDRLKLVGTLAGVIFAVVLASQQGGLFLAVLSRNLILVHHTDADVWILQAGAHTVEPTDPIPRQALLAARAEPDVAWAAPLLMGGARLTLPAGGTEAVVLVGVELPERRGGPFNVVAGNPSSLAQPDAVFFEDAEREKFGGLNLGDTRELNGHRVVAAGFTWGLVPVGPNSYAFTDFDTAREILHVENHLVSHVLIKAQPNASPAEIAARLRQKLPQCQVRTREELVRETIRHVLMRTPIGASLLMSTAFALVVGFVTVALTMFTSVVDKLREFGTLKALGARTSDLARLLLAQAVVVAFVGTVFGEVVASLRCCRSAATHTQPWLRAQSPTCCLAKSTRVVLPRNPNTAPSPTAPCPPAPPANR